MKTLLKIGILGIVVGFLFNGCGTPAIYEAVEHSDLQKVKTAVSNGAKWTEENGYKSPLRDAVIKNNLEIVKYLVEAGSNVNHYDWFGEYIIHHACTNANQLEMVKYLVEHGAKVNVRVVKMYPNDTDYNQTPLQYASRWGTYDVVKYLVEHDADIHARDLIGWTPLHYASRWNNYDVVKYLAEHGANIDIRDNEGKLPADVTSDIKINNYLKSVPEKREKERQEKEELARKKVQEELIDKINTMVANQDFDTLKTLSEENPNYVNYIANTELRLMLTGPKGMKVGDILKLLTNGKSEIIIISLIKQVEEPYKKYTLDEIDILSKMGLTDKVISSMIDITTELLKDEKMKKQQEVYLAEQKRIAEQKTQTQVIYQTVNNGNNNNQENDLANKVQDKLIEKGTEILFKKLFR